VTDSDGQLDETRPRRWRVTFGFIALLGSLVFHVAAWAAMDGETLLLPPMFIFFTLDHQFALAVIVFLICALDVALKRTPGRIVVLVLAIIVLYFVAASVRESSRPGSGEALLGYQQ
jgi:hypothetical protein